MQFRRWALNTALAGAALILGGLILSGIGGSEPNIYGPDGSQRDSALISLTTQGTWATALVILGVVLVSAAIAWTLGNNARKG